MDDAKSIVEYRMAEYGQIRVKLAEVLDSRNITRNHLSKITGIKYEIIDRYYKADHIQRVDLDLLARVCYVLDCKIEDLLEYQEP